MAFNMEAGSNKNPDLCKVEITEDLTIYAIADLKQSFAQALDNHQHFTLNLDQVEDVDSAGIQLLLALKHTLNAQNKSLTLATISKPVNDLLSNFGLNQQLEAEKQCE